MGAIYEVIARGNYDGKDWINAFEFVVTTPLSSPTAIELLTLLGFIPSGDPSAYPADTFFDKWRAAVSAAVNFVEFEARELFSLTDFYVAPALPGTAGAITGSYTASFTALGLFSNRVRTDIRRGFKRFVGVTEEMVGNFGLLETDELTLITAVADALSVPLVGASSTYNTAVIQRHRTVDSEGKVTYPLYPTRDEQMEHVAAPLLWFPYLNVRTQNSRKD